MVSSGSRNLVQMLAGWCLAIGLGAVAIVHRDDILALVLPEIKVTPAITNTHRPVAARPPRADGTVVLRASANGHYEARARINGRPIDVMVDTGASMVALTYEDAAAAGIYPGEGDFKYKVNTANGEARVAAVTLDQVSIDDITIRDVRGVVAERGKLGTTLLGMSFLSKLSRAEMSRGTLTLQE